MTKINLDQAAILSSDSPLVMGIVNVTPDSFSDGGQFDSVDATVETMLRMEEQGAHILDIGGESTRPGAADVALADELERVIPVIETLRKHSDIAISIDTSKAEVMQAAIRAGADIINDVRALQEENALSVAAQLDVPVCLMHMQGQPRTMQHAPSYNDVIDDINAFFASRVESCMAAGIRKEQIWLDPGFGFGKSLTHNFEILAKFDQFSGFGLPLLAGLSRKTMLGKVTNKEPAERVSASVAGAIIAAQNGAHIIRVHDVDETVDALKVLACTQQERASER